MYLFTPWISIACIQKRQKHTIILAVVVLYASLIFFVVYVYKINLVINHAHYMGSIIHAVTFFDGQVNNSEAFVLHLQYKTVHVNC